MKATIVCIMLFAFIIQKSDAKTITVSNKLNSPGQYTDVQLAINEATDGDTILVTGSPNDYGNIIVNKKLYIFGQGYDPRKDLAFRSQISQVTFQAAASGSLFCGFYGQYFAIEANTQNITIKRNNFINGGNLQTGCIFSDNIMLVGNIAGNNVVVSNNYIGYLSSANDIQGAIITNNHFYLNYYGVCLSVRNALVANNIFYAKSNSLATVPYVANTFNTTFNNNIYFNTTDANPLAIGVNNNTGAGNFSADPKYINFDFSSITITRNDNMQLQASSPAKNAGTDGKDIGPYGGSTPMQYPLSGEPAIPQIRSMNINNAIIPVNGTINVKLKANAGN